MSYSKTKKIKIDPLDRKWSEFARYRQPACEVCGKTEYLNAHHFIRRGISATRYDLENAVVLCSSHHTFNHDFSAHRTPEKFEKWFKKTYPERYKYLKKQSQIIMPRTQARDEFKEHYNL